MRRGIIDFHSHIAPPDWGEFVPVPPSLTNAEQILSAKKEAGIALTVITNPMMKLPGARVDLTSLYWIQRFNEFVHRLTSDYPGELVSLTGINPFGGAEMLKELERTVRDGGSKGVLVNSSVDDQFLDSLEVEELWALAVELDIPVFVHSPTLPSAVTGLGSMGLIEHIGRPCDITISVARVIMTGVLDRHPNLTLVVAMAGGALACLAGRLDLASQTEGRGVQTSVNALSTAPQLLGRPSEYLSRIYVDTTSYHSAALLANLSVFGADHMLFGTDSPPVQFPLSASIQQIDCLQVSEEDKQRIFRGNAATLLHLDPSPAS